MLIERGPLFLFNQFAYYSKRKIKPESDNSDDEGLSFVFCSSQYMTASVRFSHLSLLDSKLSFILSSDFVTAC